MSGAFIHRALRHWLFQMPGKNMGAMPLFALIDLPLLIVVPPSISLDTVRQLRIFRKRLKIKDWPSLASLYPRPMIWAYAYLLFTWARCCDVSERFFDNPEFSLIAEIFICYVCTIDRYVDSFNSRTVWCSEPHKIKRLPELKQVARTFCQFLNESPLSLHDRMQVLRLVANYRRKTLATMKKWGKTSSQTAAEVLLDKETTTGLLWYTWSKILGCVYHISSNEDISRAYFNLGMMLQLIDDLGDVPVDYQVKAQNMFLAMIRECPEEWSVCIRFLDHQTELFLNWPQARKMLPHSFSRMMYLYYSYGEKLLTSGSAFSVISEIFYVLERCRTLSG